VERRRFVGVLTDQAFRPTEHYAIGLDLGLAPICWYWSFLSCSCICILKYGCLTR